MSIGATTAPTESLAARAVRATAVATATADDVDRQARFPHESIAALRDERLLSICVPTRYGGEGAGIDDVASVVRILSTGCASTAMIYAMHQIQVWCLLRHGDNPMLIDAIAQVADRQLLLASATSEVNVGGDVRTSLCAVETTADGFRLEKQAPVISYGEYADAVLTTARRDPDSPPSDQVLVYCPTASLRLEAAGEWDTLGFRGTCSRGFHLKATGPADLILPHPYSDISSQTMLPVSHLLWASVWLGLAESAAATAHRYVRGQARKQPGTLPPAAGRLAELAGTLQEFRNLSRGAMGLFVDHLDEADYLGSLSFAVAMNSLKVSASTLVVEIAAKALSICGMSGYRQDSEFTLGRALRDAYGAALMVNNDRVIANSAQLLLASKEI